MTIGPIQQRTLRYIVGLAIGTAVAAALVAAQGESFSEFTDAVVSSSFGSPDALLNLLRWTAPLILSGLAFIVGARAGIFNTGVEGQVVVGAACAAIVGSTFSALPAIVLIPLTTLAGAAGGMLWALPAAWLFRRYRINEVVTTLMLNYIGFLLVSLVIREFFLAESGAGTESITVTSRRIASAAEYSRFTDSSEASWTIVLTFLIFVAGALVLLKTGLGYEITSVGDGARFADYAGINARGVQFRTFLISGALGGLVGAFEVQGVLNRFIDGSLLDFGWNGILVGLIGMNHPVGIGASALFLGTLENGQLAVQQFTGVSPYMIQLIASLFILVFAIDPVKKAIQTIRRRRVL